MVSFSEPHAKSLVTGAVATAAYPPSVRVRTTTGPGKRLGTRTKTTTTTPRLPVPGQQHAA